MSGRDGGEDSPETKAAPAKRAAVTEMYMMCSMGDLRILESEFV